MTCELMVVKGMKFWGGYYVTNVLIMQTKGGAGKFIV